MHTVRGTAGYERVVDHFVRRSQGLEFGEVHEDFLSFLPSTPGRVLDAGAGAGQNAAALARLGHSVVAVEPMAAFLDAARATYPGLDVTWVQDSLPDLKALSDEPGQFDFVLVAAVWQHLDEHERVHAMARMASLLAAAGVCAMTLRNGPAGAGTHLFPTDGAQTAALARRHGLEVALNLPDRPSFLPNKPGVTWTFMVLRKPIS